MPYGMCTLCGQVYHMSVGDVKEWYEQYHPNIPLCSLVPGKCFYCWQELKLGDSVVVRSVFADAQNPRRGEVGVIKEILASEDGSLFLVGLSSDKEVYMIRAQLRKLRAGEGEPKQAEEPAG